MSTAIEFNNISKQYKLGLVSTKTLSHDLNRWWQTKILHKEDPYLKIGSVNDRSSKADSDYVWALKDIDFKVEQGDVLGIIGKNGAGKSTLLKLLSRVTNPTTGTIRARGRIASLLEVGTGFHPELTGRENIYMNGSIMGMNKAEITRKMDEIVAFSGCERYIDTPVKRYSSGMMVRLGFSVAAHLDPEILVVDEVLAVGDLEFQDKAIGKMHEVSKGEGRTVLFVSHNLSAIKRLCTRGIILQKGMVDYVGSVSDCVSRYVSEGSSLIESHKIITPSDHIHNEEGNLNHNIEFVEVSILNDNPSELATDESISFDIKCRCNNYNTKQFQCNIIFSNIEGVRVAVYTTDLINVPMTKGEFVINATIIKPALPKGLYKVRFEAETIDYSKGVYKFDHLRDVLSFEIRYVNKEKRNEYLFWESSWGLRLHNSSEMIIKLL